MPVGALIFDFNGTLSDDEPLLCELFMHLFAEHGRPMSAQEYFDQLAGLSDPEIVKTWLGEDHPDVEAVIGERVRRYREAAADGSTVHEHVREAVRYAADYTFHFRPEFPIRAVLNQIGRTPFRRLFQGAFK